MRRTPTSENANDEYEGIIYWNSLYMNCRKSRIDSVSNRIIKTKDFFVWIFNLDTVDGPYETILLGDTEDQIAAGSVRKSGHLG